MTGADSEIRISSGNGRASAGPTVWTKWRSGRAPTPRTQLVVLLPGSELPQIAPTPDERHRTRNVTGLAGGTAPGRTAGPGSEASSGAAGGGATTGLGAAGKPGHPRDGDRSDIDHGGPRFRSSNSPRTRVGATSTFSQRVGRFLEVSWNRARRRCHNGRSAPRPTVRQFDGPVGGECAAV